MKLKAGSVSNFSNSMAQAMEDSFQREWNAIKKHPLSEAGEEDRRLLFSAIAQGVIQHLQEHINDALQIDVRVTQTNEPLNNTGNRVIAEGEAINVELLTE
ncbi:MAG: hypothetical protein GY819_13105 [Planctomycetaceae bacterium]|nr:hypothetical protein [Planctomycetaceae bacterium]